MAGAGAHLLERAVELAALDGALEAARAGHGALLLVEGPPGIGKTALLAAAAARARRPRMLVLSARGGELELSFPYAVVRQLFEPALSAADRQTRDRLLCGAAAHARPVVDPEAASGAAAAEPAAVLHGLYWLTANLAADRPVLLVVDDLHWTDAASVSWLLYLARRIEGLAVAMIVATRPVEPGAGETVLEPLRVTGGLQRVQPTPLSAEAIDALARTALGEQVEPAFAVACHASTGGNPFYVTELLRALGQERVAGSAADVAAIDAVTPRAVVDATLARLGHLPSEVRAVAEAAALLEPNAELRWIAELTGLDIDAVAAAADALLALGMLRAVAPCHFAHPILRSAVTSEISPGRRGRLHLKAAHALALAGMPAGAVAAHLMQAPPFGDAWVVSAFQRAAAQASAHGAPDGAVTYLERALAERPPAHRRRELLLELGKAESQIHGSQAQEHLREALALAEDPEHIAMAALWLGQSLYHAGSVDEAYEMLAGVVGRTEGMQSQALLELEAYLLSLAGAAGRLADTADRARSLDERTPPGSPAAGAVDATMAFRAALAGDPRAQVRERVERALLGMSRSFSSVHAADRQAPGVTLVWIDDLDRAAELLTELIRGASEVGRLQAFEIFSALRGFAVRRRGDLADAAADIEPVLAPAALPERLGVAHLVARITQVQLLVDAGRPDTAEALARATPVPAGFERGFMAAMLRQAEGAAQLAQRKFGAAAATLTGVGELCENNAIRSPAAFPWRSDLALALAGTDRHAEGVELARAELRLAERCDVDRARGIALRTLGLLEGGLEGVRHLEAAVQALQRAPAPLELGWASYELGAALRRANRRRDARPPLDRALDLALACGAQLLGRSAREELQALGARPRSVMLTGAEALTPSERRVCRLASEGLKNSEIAQALFVSLRTVETHLGSSFRKLDISSRVELPHALGSANR